MTLLVVGATAANLEWIGSAARRQGMRVVAGATIRRPDWVLVARAAERLDAFGRYRLPAFRVIEVPALATDDVLDARVVSAGLARMRELGPFRPTVSALGVAAAGLVMPGLVTLLERILGSDTPDPDLTLALKAKKAAARAAERAARRRERAQRVESPEEARRRAERKAQRKAARRADGALAAQRPGVRRTS